MSPIGLLSDIPSFAVGLLVGGVAFTIAARYVHRDRSGRYDFRHAVVTALLCAVALAVLSAVPVLGPVLALAGWLVVLRVRYPGGWVRAASTGVVAWAAAVVVLAALEFVGLRGLPAVGVPGT